MEHNIVYEDSLEELNDLVYRYLYFGDFPQLDYGELEPIMLNIKGICDNLKDLDIMSGDFLNPENIGFRGEKMVYFDIGFGDDEDLDKFDSNAITIDENSENHKLYSVGEKIFQMQNMEVPRVIGSGNFGLAFSDGNVVYKITKDLSEGSNASKLIGKNLEYLVNYYRTIPFKYDGGRYYYIEMEQLKTNPQKALSNFKALNRFLENSLV